MIYIYFYILIYIFLCKKVFFSKKNFQSKTFFFPDKNIFSANNVYFVKKNIFFFKKKFFFNLVLQQMNNHTYAQLLKVQKQIKRNRSLIDKLKRSGPSIEPCGTPAITFFKLLNLLLKKRYNLQRISSKCQIVSYVISRSSHPEVLFQSDKLEISQKSQKTPCTGVSS